MLPGFKSSKGKGKVFCVSVQRSGTTSTGRLFKELGYQVASWSVSRKNGWGEKCYWGDFESIIKSRDFANHSAFEDGPWWYPDFYRFLFHRLPESKFVLVERDSDKWFDSMLSHSDGKTLGNTMRHCWLYDREDEFFAANDWDLKRDYDVSNIDNLLPLNESHREHYKKIYEAHNFGVKLFFQQKDPSRLACTRLEDDSKWDVIAAFLGHKRTQSGDVHLNKSS